MSEQFQVILSTAQEGPTGIILYVTDTDFRCVDRNQGEVTLTSGQRKFLRKLACNVNCTVSYQALYEAYSKTNVDGDDSAIPGYVIRMRDSFRDPPRDQIKRSIKSVRREGYRLLGTKHPWNAPESAISGNPDLSVCKMGRISDLAGDYYGFYLDHWGRAKVRCAYLHIENNGSTDAPDLKAYAILGIRNTDLLLHKGIPELFRQNGQYHREAFREFKRPLRDNDKRCYWGEGHVAISRDMVVISLTTKEDGSGKWHMILDIGNYLKCGRERISESDRYRGGLGLAVKLSEVHGSICFRFGMIQKSFGRKVVENHWEEIPGRLRLTEDVENAQWKPLRLSKWLDQEWYEWMMGSQS